MDLIFKLVCFVSSILFFQLLRFQLAFFCLFVCLSFGSLHLFTCWNALASRDHLLENVDMLKGEGEDWYIKIAKLYTLFKFLQNWCCV